MRKYSNQDDIDVKLDEVNLLLVFQLFDICLALITLVGILVMRAFSNILPLFSELERAELFFLLILQLVV
jgi:hypothetical protein